MSNIYHGKKSSRHDPDCHMCQGTGMRDTGGVHPWGEPIFEECDCHLDYGNSKVIEHNKEQFALEISSYLMKQINKPMTPYQLKMQIYKMTLDSIEFGIQLGGMEWKEGE